MISLCMVLGLATMITAEKLTPILPGDPYSVVGDIEKRQLGRCTYLYTWLAIPQGSHQDIYAHYSACSRLELRFIETARETRSPQSDFKTNVVEELNRINKDYTAQLIDLETLDALLQTVKVTNGIQTSPPLTTKDRIFYLADRLGQYTMLAMLRPGRLPKIEIVPPPSEKTHILPQNVLCYRKTCESPVKSDTLRSSSMSSEGEKNSSVEYIVLLAEAKQENRRLYVQLIIYRVVFALAIFLCVILAIVTLILCFRSHKSGPKLPKKLQKMEASYHSAPPYNSLNSASKMTSPAMYSDSVAYPNNTALVLGDTSSLQNTAISSNLSGCELLAANGLSGTPCSHFYQPLYTTDGSGGIKPITQSRLYGSSGQNFYPLVTAFDRSASPASEGYRTGSLDRRSDAASEKIRRRTPIQLIALPQGAEAPPTANYIALAQPISQYPQTAFKAPQSSDNVQTIASHGSGGTVIRKLPSDINFSAGINGESTSSGVAMS